MNFEYLVAWHFDGNEQEKAAYNKKARMYQKEHLKAHNKFCNIVNNGVTDSLNAEWQKMHPGPVEDEDRYMAFIAKGYSIGISRKGLKTRHMTFSIGADGQLVGHPKTGGCLYFTLYQR